MISIIVPCYNEQEALPLFHKEITRVLQEMGESYELLLVNDGSRDSTLDVMRTLAQEDGHVVYLSFSRNFGKEAAMYAGFCNAQGDYVAVMDADLQDPPALLPKMLELLQTGEYDSVATRRVSRAGEPPVRSWFARRFYQLINKISDADIVDGARDFRLMRRSMVDAILSMSEYNRFSKGIFGWVGFRTYWLPFENVERVAGQTKWNFWGLFKYAIDGIIDFSQAPLSVASWFGIGMTFCSILAILFIVVRACCLVTRWQAGPLPSVSSSSSAACSCSALASSGNISQRSTLRQSTAPTLLWPNPIGRTLPSSAELDKAALHLLYFLHNSRPKPGLCGPKPVFLPANIILKQAP